MYLNQQHQLHLHLRKYKYQPRKSFQSPASTYAVLGSVILPANHVWLYAVLGIELTAQSILVQEYTYRSKPWNLCLIEFDDMNSRVSPSLIRQHFPSFLYSDRDLLTLTPPTHFMIQGNTGVWTFTITASEHHMETTIQNLNLSCQKPLLEIQNFI